MADVTFKQDPRLAPEMFVLQGDTLLVTGGVPPKMNMLAAIKSWADLGAYGDSALVLAIGVVALVRAKSQPDEAKKDQARKAGYFLIILGLVLLGRHFI